jgi:hypothetical protein
MEMLVGGTHLDVLQISLMCGLTGGVYLLVCIKLLAVGVAVVTQRDRAIHHLDMLGNVLLVLLLLLVVERH